MTRMSYTVYEFIVQLTFLTMNIFGIIIYYRSHDKITVGLTMLFSINNKDSMQLVQINSKYN